jgi:thiamine-monophosphate kinase
LSRESDFIGLLRSFATNPAARGLADDCAVLEIGAETLIVTHDMMAEGVHFLPDADPADVAWKLVAANLSDLAAKGAEPVGVLLGFTLGEGQWDKAFAEGLREVSPNMTFHCLAGILSAATRGGFSG